MTDASVDGAPTMEPALPPEVSSGPVEAPPDDMELGDTPGAPANETPSTVSQDPVTDSSDSVPGEACTGCVIAGVCYVDVLCSESVGVLTGTITVGGAPLEEAEVRVDEFLNWRATTDEAGFFIISGIALGDHELSVDKELDDGSVVALAGSLEVASGVTDLGEVVLPEPSALEPIALTGAEVTLAWSPYSGGDFREYRVYRRDSAGLDETTGTLLFTTTDPEETSFVDTEYTSGVAYFYRVFVHTDLGRLAGSNLQRIETPVENLVYNSSFEQPLTATEPIAGWYVVSAVPELDADAVSGSVGLKLTVSPTNDGDPRAQQDVAVDRFEVGRDYEVSGWLKASPDVEAAVFVWAITEPYSAYLAAEPISVEGGLDWHYGEAIFTIAADVVRVTLALEVFPPANATTDAFAWFDDVAITVE